MSNADRIERLTDLLDELDRELRASQAATGRRLRGVGLVVAGSALLTGVLALSNLFFVNDLAQEIRLIIGRMQEMRGHVTTVAGRMETLRSEIGAIEGNVRLLPVVAAQMHEIAGHVDAMQSGVGDLEGSTGRLDRHVGQMDLAVRDMAGRFHGLNQAVGAMGGDVNQMARPVP